MFNSPFLGFPFNSQYYRYNNKMAYNNSFISKSNISRSSEAVTNNTSDINNCKNSENKNNSITTSNEVRNTIDDAIFEIFGIKLYLDDLIIVALLFFLYNQEIKDDMLYIILFLLLFS